MSGQQSKVTKVFGDIVDRSNTPEKITSTTATIPSISTNAESTFINASVAATVNLDDGEYPGMHKHIFSTGAGTVTLDPTNSFFNTIPLAAGQSVGLLWDGAKWYVEHIYGATPA